MSYIWEMLTATSFSDMQGEMSGLQWSVQDEGSRSSLGCTYRCCESSASDGFKPWHQESKQMEQRRQNREQRLQAGLEEGKKPASETGKDTHKEVGLEHAHCRRVLSGRMQES